MGRRTEPDVHALLSEESHSGKADPHVHVCSMTIWERQSYRASKNSG